MKIARNSSNVNCQFDTKLEQEAWPRRLIPHRRKFYFSPAAIYILPRTRLAEKRDEYQNRVELHGSQRRVNFYCHNLIKGQADPAIWINNKCKSTFSAPLVRSKRVRSFTRLLARRWRGCSFIWLFSMKGNAFTAMDGWATNLASFIYFVRAIEITDVQKDSLVWTGC